MKKTGTIEAISTKTVATKFGNKPVYSIKVDNDWYNAGFAKVPGKGTVVEFDYEESTYGKEITKKSLISKSAAPQADTSGGPDVPNNGKSTVSQSNNKGVFPVPVHDGSRAIIRQNATTNANYLLRTLIESGSLGELDLNQASKVLVETARYIEEYTTGDADKSVAKQAAIAVIKERAWQDTADAFNTTPDVSLYIGQEDDIDN